MAVPEVTSHALRTKHLGAEIIAAFVIPNRILRHDALTTSSYSIHFVAPLTIQSFIVTLFLITRIYYECCNELSRGTAAAEAYAIVIR